MCGEFNTDLLNKDCNNITRLHFGTQCIYCHLILPIISKQSNITDNSVTLIDNFFINEPCNFKSGILISEISDHFPIFFTHKKSLLY